MTWYLFQRQREPLALEAKTKAEALSELRARAAEELDAAKRRFGAAYLHKHGESMYSITLARDERSALWTDLFVTTDPI